MQKKKKKKIRRLLCTLHVMHNTFENIYSFPAAATNTALPESTKGMRYQVNFMPFYAAICVFDKGLHV